MRSRELMIGDLVYYPEGWVIRIKQYNRGNTEFAPIPLTEEILEKNGWEKKEYPEFVQWWSPDGRCLANLGISNSKEWFVHFDDEHYSTIGYFECDYVHELQHAMRLCGLAELADNLKV